MKPAFEVYIIVQKPVAEVFDAVYNPKKISAYFTTAQASAPLVEGTTVQWEFADFPGAFPVHSKQIVKDKLIVIEWGSSEENGQDNRVEFSFEALNEQETKVKVTETGWSETEKGVKSSYGNCMGWSQMLCAMKAYLEYGINLRQGAYKTIHEQK
ncbi:SRPBCC domain-containing protein [Bdellovibrio sp. 22V]|uniref:SRPBCC domain-containing protein n=1 Tax=Bdellovibrio TaxID=958 RepID=UPI0025434FC3|nr:SRPBCC domain-containing protein [Bdellovibrio sp. 22V]WII71029.1 SRPBCC domain-containing protein [Bdellovibrio sp. 22V]